MGAYTNGSTRMFAERLKYLREKNGHTLESLAEVLEVSKQQVWRWETDRNEPLGSAVAKVATYFNVTADYLLGLVEEPHQMLAEEQLSIRERRVITAIRSGMPLDAIGEIIKIGQDGGET